MVFRVCDDCVDRLPKKMDGIKRLANATAYSNFVAAATELEI